MKKKIVFDEVEIGMTFSEPLYTEDNELFIKAGKAIDESDYNRMVRWGVKELYTDGEIIEKEKVVNTKNKKFKFEEEDNDKVAEYIKMYKWCLSMYEDFLTNFIENNEFDISRLEVIVNKIFDLVGEYKNDIISYMALEPEIDDYLIIHTINSTIIAIIGGIQLNMNEKDLVKLGVSSLLHDLGMLKVPKKILNKKEKLTDEEYNLIKSHPIAAYKEMNKSSVFDQDILDAVLQHHEQFDGNGYPRKMKGEQVNIFAKIIAIADTFEAQIAFRAYRESKTGYLAMKSVLAEAQNRFDPKVLRAFLVTLSIYPPGTLVQMNDNSIGVVFSINSDAPLRPKVKIIIDEFGDKISEDIVKDLKDENNLFILHVLNKEEYKKK